MPDRNEPTLTRRRLLQMGLAAGAAGTLNLLGGHGADATPAKTPAAKLKATADSVIVIWLPGGVAQTDTWDPKKFTPYVQGMKGGDILGTCPSITTAADGIRLGAGLENIASVMDKGTILRSLTNQTKFGAVHLKAQYYMMTGYLFPAGVQAPSLGAVVSRTLGRRDPNIPAYIDIGRDINTSNEEFLFINEFMGPGFYGVKYAPFMIPEPAQGLPTLKAVAGMDMTRLDRRQHYLEAITGLSAPTLRSGPPRQGLHQSHGRCAGHDGLAGQTRLQVRRRRRSRKRSKPTTSATGSASAAFSPGRLVEGGARFVQVEYQYEPFGGFDMHADGQSRMKAMKAQVDRPIAQLIRDLDQRGLLERTLVVVMTEFGRTIANQPAAGTEAFGFAERSTGSDLIIQNEKMYGFHGHFSSGNCMLFFGGGFKKGFVYGKTADAHPLLPIENPVRLEDVHATIYKALGIPADTNYVTEQRPFYVTNNGKGVPIDALLA